MMDDRTRLLAYPYCNLVVLCFDMTSKESIAGIEDKWLVEISHHCQEKPVIFLVGLKSEGNNVVTDSEVQSLLSLASFGKSYIVSAKQDPGRVKEIFEEMVTVAGQERKKIAKPEKASVNEEPKKAADAPKPRRGCHLF
eukprot:TRINITY_DN3955_c0_g1_i1.p1 TRINITY_DN3955_c0_g1~~TRINITY_DN3955_c0_g1_i1.p1  ORF type:complete len:139 (+),score=29.95 TRINITY_DN3955_c0_g1_i1:311-727(+)